MQCVSHRAIAALAILAIAGGSSASARAALSITRSITRSITTCITPSITPNPAVYDASSDSSATGVSSVGDVMIPLTLHQASFTQMPGVPNCCTEFRFGMGTGFSLAGGVQRKELTRFMGMDVVSGAKLRVSYEQTTMSEQN
ncbi:MAG: hypothetical protein ACK45R_07470, partial [Candidatus Kapaibacterium sp.]